MNNLINRQDAIDAIEAKEANEFGNYMEYNVAFNDGLRSAVFALEEFPSAEPERKTGKWIEHHRTDLGEKLNHCIECSECKIWFSIDELLRRSFCPNCGADMRDGDAE